jgi:hypothetical protein
MDYRSLRASYDAAPRRPLNPLLRRQVRRSGRSIVELSLVAGFSHKQVLYQLFAQDSVPATPLMVKRLHRLADFISFPREDVFLDEAGR